MIDDLIERIRTASPKEKAALAAVMKDILEPKPEPEYKQLGKPFDFRPKDEHGRLLTDEELWDREHALLPRLKPYGFTETSINGLTGQKTTKKWTRAEVDAYNEPIQQEWLQEKRKLFPDAQLPPTPDMGTTESRFDDPRYSHPERVY